MTLRRSRARMIDKHTHNHMQTCTHSSVLLTHTMLTDLMIIKNGFPGTFLFSYCTTYTHKSYPPPPPPTHTHTPFLHKLKMGHRCLQCPLLLSTYSSPYTYTDWRLDKHTAHANDNLKQVLWNWLLAASEKLWLVFSISQLGRSHQGSSEKRSTEQVCKNWYCYC